MKPIKLIMSAFGPYAEEIPPIEFNKLEDKGLFLISGDTGAGKTTIFDAICFALFGTTSGSYKSNKKLRSEYAKEDTKSFVDFYFSHQGAEYRVYREPAYERINRNGRLVEEAERVIFFRQDGTTIEGKSGVDGTKDKEGAIRELLHIDEKQFKQIVMIAQGEFFALLNAKTEERTNILRTIFMTDGYKNIEYKLKEKMNRANEKKTSSEQSILQYFDDVTIDGESDKRDELATIKQRAKESKSVWNVEEICEIIQQIIEEDNQKKLKLKDELTREEQVLGDKNNVLATADNNNALLAKIDKLQAEKLSLDEQSPEMQELSKELERNRTATYSVKPCYDAYNTLTVELQDIVSNINSLKSQIAGAEANVKECSEYYTKLAPKSMEADAIKQKALTIEGEEEKYKERDKLKEEVSSFEIKAGKYLEKEAELKEKEEKLKKKISSLNNQVSLLRNKPEELIEINAYGEKLSKLYAAIHKIIAEKIPAYDEKLSVYKDRQEDYLRACEVYRKVKKQEEHAKEIIDGCRAGILAMELKEGDSCPVCGSTHHIKLATLPKEYIGEDEYKKLKDALELAQNNNEAAVTAAEGAKQSFESFKEQLIIEIKECLSHELYSKNSDGVEFEVLIDMLKDEQESVADMISSCKEEKKELELKCCELNNVNEELELLRGIETENLEALKSELANNIKDNNAVLIEKKTKLQQMLKLPFDNLMVAIAEKERLFLESNGIYDSIEEARRKKEESERSFEKLNTERNTLEKSKVSKEEKLENNRKIFLEKLQQYSFENPELLVAYFADDKELAQKEKIIKDFSERKLLNAKQLNSSLEEAKGKKYIETEALKQDIENQKQRVEAIRNNLSSVDHRLTTNSDRLKQILSKKDIYNLSFRQHLTCERLYKLVTGQTGKGKITLEQYIQASGFDQIIRAANRRLLPMSEGRFELFRQEDSLGRRSNTFLDLEVLDNYTGKRRPVGNMSGGESFKASLSLALGLSDTVSSNLGGVQMDALFIDEGFGTLDRKSLDNAIDILVNLATNNKLVGIISHREELMENIPQQIKVKNSKNGSKMFFESL